MLLAEVLVLVVVDLQIALVHNLLERPELRGKDTQEVML
jgi:hypothetical protein